ncbi:Receptor-type tyrosine-protein phosphatase kappa [Anabarilius grahami]|uniref:Receptor-type tyrosine-protein phosphatase kappa n=1 Tax=Anabarilius grahami TaxID=495550 RepID=A0A3N0YE30_ANAGA|nr:Receptor-type tyrosine-protein phosphatase kappa [Anabarilius grahami]
MSSPIGCNNLCSYMMVDTSQHDYGEKARLQLPVMKENDTHCIDFNYLLYCPDGSSPGTLNILVKVNKGPLANPIWNVTSCTGRDWMKAELAVSTFWPNEYQGSQLRVNADFPPSPKTRSLRAGDPGGVRKKLKLVAFDYQYDIWSTPRHIPRTAHLDRKRLPRHSVQQELAF